MCFVESMFNSIRFSWFLRKCSYNISKYVCVFGAFCVCVCVYLCVFVAFRVFVCDEKSLRTLVLPSGDAVRPRNCNRRSATSLQLPNISALSCENFKIEYCSLKKILKLSAIASLDISETSLQLPNLLALLSCKNFKRISRLNIVAWKRH